MTEKSIIKESWTGRHRGIHFEICKHMMDAEGGPWWNTYIVLNNRYNKDYLEYLWTDEVRTYTRFNGKVVKYQDAKNDWNYLSWNGGVTFYEQRDEPDWEFRSIKVGDDYQHSWDYERGRGFLDLDYMVMKCKKMIDELIELMKEKGIPHDAIDN